MLGGVLAWSSMLEVAICILYMFLSRSDLSQGINGSSRETNKSQKKYYDKTKKDSTETTCCDRHLEIPGVSNNTIGTLE